MLSTAPMPPVARGPRLLLAELHQGRDVGAEPGKMDAVAAARAADLALEAGAIGLLAEQRIADLMANAPEGTIGVKLSTPRRGCSGLTRLSCWPTRATCKA